MTTVIDRETTQTAPVVTPEREAPAARRQPIPRWIEMLVFLGFAFLAGLGLWLLAETTGYPSDGSFEVAEQMRFERIGAEAQLVTVAELVEFEDLVNPSIDHSQTVAETLRFHRIGGLDRAITVDEFAELEDRLGP